MNWTEEDLKLLNEKRLSNKTKKVSKKTRVKKISVEKTAIETILWVLKKEGVIDGHISEHRFHPTREWRFDWVIPTHKIAIEYEGIISAKSRHTTIKGFSGDCEKYNEAVKLGWRVLRYTAVNYKNLDRDLKNLIVKY